MAASQTGASWPKPLPDGRPPRRAAPDTRWPSWRRPTASGKLGCSLCTSSASASTACMGPVWLQHAYPSWGAHPNTTRSGNQEMRSILNSHSLRIGPNCNRMHVPIHQESASPDTGPASCLWCSIERRRARAATRRVEYGELNTIERLFIEDRNVSLECGRLATFPGTSPTADLDEPRQAGRGDATTCEGLTRAR